MKNLIILESPTKINKVKPILENAFPNHSFTVKASMGHISELSLIGNHNLGIDFNTFQPQFNISKDKEKLVKELQALAKSHDSIYLATDPDREGEAIAWHLSQQFPNQQCQRMTFNEITVDAVTNAFNQPRKIDLRIVNSQKTRQMFDRIIGFRLSNLLQAASSAKSAGRVQSVALLLAVNRYLENQGFAKVKYFTLNYPLVEVNQTMNIKLVALANGEEINKTKSLKTKDQVDAIINNLSDFKVIKITETKFKDVTKVPLITSTLLQGGFALGLSSEKITLYAQQLYENGYITYPRTDSPRFAPEFVSKAKAYLSKALGSKYVIKGDPIYKLKDDAQNAHEGIRPTKIELPKIKITENEMKDKSLHLDSLKLYEFIYNHTVSTLMALPYGQNITITFDNNNTKWELLYKRYDFLGYKELGENKDYWINQQSFPILGKLNIDSVIKCHRSELIAKEQETKPQPLYNESTLVKAMEYEGVGRPSTYASVMKTIINRGYVTEIKNKLTPTATGIKVNEFLQKYFPSIINLKYTAQMETQLDKIAQENLDSTTILKDFYHKFDQNLNQVLNAINVNREKCPKCNIGYFKELKGKSGTFWACSNYPSCKNIKSDNKPQLTFGKCSKCNVGTIIERNGKSGKFQACNNFPTCKNILNKGAH